MGSDAPGSSGLPPGGPSRRVPRRRPRPPWDRPTRPRPPRALGRSAYSRGRRSTRFPDPAHVQIVAVEEVTEQRAGDAREPDEHREASTGCGTTPPVHRLYGPRPERSARTNDKCSQGACAARRRDKCAEGLDERELIFGDRERRRWGSRRPRVRGLGCRRGGPAGQSLGRPASGAADHRRWKVALPPAAPRPALLRARLRTAATFLAPASSRPRPPPASLPAHSRGRLDLARSIL